MAKNGIGYSYIATQTGFHNYLKPFMALAISIKYMLVNIKIHHVVYLQNIIAVDVVAMQMFCPMHMRISVHMRMGRSICTGCPYTHGTAFCPI